jgi:putative transposase
MCRVLPNPIPNRSERAAESGAAGSIRAAKGRATHGVIFHSDRGSEYIGAPFCTAVAHLGLLQSASVRGPGDNAHAESFFHSLKAELIRGEHFATDHTLRTALTSYIRSYNTVRLHSGLHYHSPLAFERGVA